MVAVVSKDFVLDGILQHPLRSVGCHISHAVVVVAPGCATQLAKGVEKKSPKQTKSDPQLKDKNLGFQSASLFRCAQTDKQRLCSVLRKHTIVVYQIWDSAYVAKEGFRP